MKKYNYLLKNIAIMFCILFLIFIIHSVYIAGPIRAYEKEDRLIVETMMKKEKYKEAQLLSRFSYDDVYYVVRVETGELVYFNKDLSFIAKREFVPLDLVFSLADELNINHENISYGVYKEDLIFVLKTKMTETFVDPDTLDIVKHFGSDY